MSLLVATYLTVDQRLVWQAKINLDASRNVSGGDGVYGCMWAGITRLKTELGPGETRHLDLQAVFTQVRS